ncbi:MAG: zinc ribbon domain-containing protein [Candidatus Eremiobacteraeota bacterium]|nr:zinc ribbon domain-containing protein [Candidatus Eremiobacteraeota bacterium]MCW5870841.1 zinc ribbon domain-containing protein [Candidatus Eremiobacteraeota bacterium]
MKLFSVIGGEDPQEVIPLVDAQLAVAERELREVPERAQARGAEFVAAVQDKMQAVIEQFRLYHAWLQNSRQALESNDHNQLVAAYEEAQTLVPALFAALEAYGAAYAAQGPFATPFSNTLARIAAGIHSGQAGEESWDDYLNNFSQVFAGKIAQVREAALPGRGACGQAYQQGVEVLQKLQGLEALDPASLKAPLHELDEAIALGEKVERLMAEGLEGPAPIPMTNVIISVVRKGLGGELDSTLVSSFLDDYRDLLDGFWEGFERSISRPSESALVQQEIPRTLESGDEHDAAVEELMNGFAKKDSAACEAAIARLVATAQKLDESREVYNTAAQHQGQTLCPGCGRANPPENKRCEACGNVLPTESGAASSSSFNVMAGPALEETQELGMTDNVAKLFSACDNVSEGKISLNEFQNVVTEAMVGLKELAKELDEIATETMDESNMNEETRRVWREHHLPHVQEVGAAFVAGMSDCEAGLKSMQAYVSEQDNEHLINGVRLVWEGLNVIHRARLAMNSNLQMLQDVLQEAREAGYLTDVPEETDA